jgi:hypothetical protein
LLSVFVVGADGTTGVPRFQENDVSRSSRDAANVILSGDGGRVGMLSSASLGTSRASELYQS